MFRIYTVILDVLKELRPVVAAIEVHDRDLGRQLRRAATSVALNAQEGSGSHGGTRRERYRNALGSARETGACLDAALALGYLESVDAGLLDRLDHVRAVLAKSVR
jgi:four helix bundle protein